MIKSDMLSLKTDMRVVLVKGFTLIEVMVVIVILGILATLVIPNIIDRPDAARLAKAKQDMRTIEGALSLYKLDNFTYPSQDQGLEALSQKPSGSPEPKFWKQGGYIDRLPKDPWGAEYKYRNPGIKNPNRFDIYTLGADGKEGGEGSNADIGNWD